MREIGNIRGIRDIRKHFAGGGVPLDPDAEAYINAGGVTSAAVKAKLNQLFLDVKGLGSTTNNTDVFSKLIWWYITNHTDLFATSINAANPGTYDVTWNGMVEGDRTSDGIKGDGISKAGDTNYLMSSIPQNDNCFGVGVHTVATGSTVDYIGAYNNGVNFHAILRGAANDAYYPSVTSPQLDINIPAAATLIMGTRNGAATYQGYSDGASAGSGTAASTAHSGNNPNVMLLAEGRTGGNTRFSDGRIYTAVHGNSVTANEAQDFYDALNTYMTP